MKRKLLFPMSFNLITICAVLVLSISIIQLSCNGKPESQTVTDSFTMKNWVTLDIKFKPGTSDEMMDMSIRIIKKALIDSINTLRHGVLPNFAPNISTTSNPWSGPSSVTLMMAYSSSDSLPNPSCPKPCSQQCGVCFMVANAFSLNPNDSSSKVIESIASEGDIRNF